MAESLWFVILVQGLMLSYTLSKFIDVVLRKKLNYFFYILASAAQSGGRRPVVILGFFGFWLWFRFDGHADSPSVLEADRFPERPVPCDFDA